MLICDLQNVSYREPALLAVRQFDAFIPTWEEQGPEERGERIRVFRDKGGIWERDIKIGRRYNEG